MKKIISYEIVDLGINWPDYFPGFGTSLRPFIDHVVGVGDTYNNALADALDVIAQSHDINSADLDTIEQEERVSDKINASVSATDYDTEDGDEVPYYYVGIRYNLEEGEENE
jgi:hypothetical protein